MSVEVTSRVWKHSRTEGTLLLLMLALGDHANNQGICWPSVESLCEKTRRKDDRHVRRLIRELVVMGELEVRPGGGRHHSSLYWVRVGLPEDTPAPWEKGACRPGFPLGKGGVSVRVSGEKGGADDRVSTEKGGADDRVSTERGGAQTRVSAQNPGVPHPDYKEEPSERIQIDSYLGNLPRQLLLLDEQLRGLPGYDPDECFYALLAGEFCDGRLNLQEQGMRINGWFTDPRNRKARSRVCNRGFVLGWLRREKNRLSEGRAERVEVRRPHVVGSGLERFR